MKIGIDQITFYIPKTYISLETLAKEYNVDYNKYKYGLLIEKMAVNSYNQDIITMGLNASLKLINDNNKNSIGMVIFATESALDYSKSSSIYIANYLDLNEDVEVLEVKQACFGLTQALNIATNYIKSNYESGKQVLIIGSDTARYEPASNAEATGGSGAVSLIVSRDPRLLLFNNDGIRKYINTYDFYRPTNHKYPLVDGHFANEIYEQLFDDILSRFIKEESSKINNLKGLAFHVPYPKLPYKIINKNFNENLLNLFNESITYNKNIGNIYNSSLYLNLINLLDLKQLKSGDLIGLYSYGSGSTAQFSTMTVVGGYQNHLYTFDHIKQLENRSELKFFEYMNILEEQSRTDYNDGPYIIDNIDLITKVRKYILRK